MTGQDGQGRQPAEGHRHRHPGRRRRHRRPAGAGAAAPDSPRAAAPCPRIFPRPCPGSMRHWARQPSRGTSIALPLQLGDISL